ncbi:hypothetical protein AHF37_06160 [Paragonimus kellicotti]|nr:hypothetical protein AHF37_06160 [Paragonimus kellicotti]
MEGEFHGPVAIGSAQLEQVVSESAIVEQEIEVGSIAVERVETVERAELGEEFPTEAAAVVSHAVTVPVEAGPYLESIVVDEVRSELGRIDRIMEGEFHGPVAIGSAQLEQVVSESAIVEQEIEVGSIAVERVETVEPVFVDGLFPNVGFDPDGCSFFSDENIVSSHTASLISCVEVSISDQLSEVVLPSVKFTDNLLEVETSQIGQQPLAEELRTDQLSEVVLPSVKFTDNLLEVETSQIGQQPLAEELRTGKPLEYLIPTVIILA